MTHVLIVEDEQLIARLIEMSLTRAGYDCTVAGDGRTAADLIEEKDYDLALLDIMLPGLDGYELLDYLRPQGVPVIFITAKGTVKERVEGLRRGADDYIVKPFVVEELYRQTGGDATVVTEVGQHQMWAAQYYKYTKPRTLLTSGGLGTMGYGLGAALGAKTGCPDKTVVNIAGDGCFRMNMNEIATAVRHNIPIIEVVVNNHVLGMVRQWQDLFYDERYSATVLRDAVDFVKLAESMGAVGIRAETQEQFRKAFADALGMGRPVVIDCQIDSDDKVWPMVAPGTAISDAFDEDDMKKKKGGN